VVDLAPRSTLSFWLTLLMLFLCSCRFFEWVDNAPKDLERPAKAAADSAWSPPDGLTEADEQFFRANAVSLYVACELSHRLANPFWKKKAAEGESSKAHSAKSPLYLKLGRQREHSSQYAKDDVWIVSSSPDFTMRQGFFFRTSLIYLNRTPEDILFLALSVFHGPTKEDTIEIAPLSGQPR
jgi:hypothetical protein